MLQQKMYEITLAEIIASMTSSTDLNSYCVCMSAGNTKQNEIVFKAAND
jgi:hypothetical protein